MQFSVPQFVEVEDKIIGPLTLKQFLIMVAGGLVVLALWSILKLSIIFFLFALPVIGFFALLAFAKFNGRSLIGAFPQLASFYFKPNFRVFMRSADSTLIVKKKDERAEKKGPPIPEKKEAISRLRQLAYLLDQKAAEEQRLIHSGGMKTKWLNQL